MANRFETTLENSLAQIFAEKLRDVLVAAGFKQTLRLAEPNLSEYQSDSRVVTLQTGHAGSQNRTVTLESESTEVEPLVEQAVKNVVLEVTTRLLDTVPWVENEVVLESVASSLREAMPHL